VGKSFIFTKFWVPIYQGLKMVHYTEAGKVSQGMYMHK
jgi:hypothetical protein